MSFRIIKGEKIKAARGNRRLSDLAEAAGVTRVAWWQWETGIYTPSNDKVPVLLNALGCAFEDISEPVDMGVSE